MHWFNNALGVGLAAICVALAPAAQAQPNAALDEFSPEFRALRIQVARTLVKIEVTNQDSSYSLGTGVVVAPGKAVTNCHVTRNAKHIHILWGGLRYLVGAQSVDAGHDLCVVHAARFEVEPAKLARAARPRTGQRTLAAGFVGGQGLQVAQGEVVALHELDGARVIQSTTAFTSGASGGGLFDADGQLLGILTFRLRGADAHYFAVPAQWISSLLDPARAAKVAPIAPPAFWQAQGATLPFFLQAAPLEAGKQWDELLRLGERWSRAEARNAQAWWVRARALSELKQDDAAQQALRKAVEIDPDFELAWYQLGLAHAADCESAEFARIAAVLQRLDQQLSARLQQAAHTSNEHRTKRLAC